MAAAPEPLEERIRVLVADDEPLLVEMVEAMLAADPRLCVVARAYNGRETVDRALALLTGGNNRRTSTRRARPAPLRTSPRIGSRTS
jgi:hypothetical protein